jgi:hypothetical protein
MLAGSSLLHAPPYQKATKVKPDSQLRHVSAVSLPDANVFEEDSAKASASLPVPHAPPLSEKPEEQLLWEH